MYQFTRISRCIESSGDPASALLAVAGVHFLVWPQLPPDAQRYPIYIYEFLTEPNTVVNTPMLHEFLGTAVGVPDPPTRKARLRVATGFELSVFAENIPHPRMLRVTPSGDVLLTQPRKGRLLLLERDGDGDGRSDGVRVLLDELHLPHGIELFEEWLFVAEADAIHRVRFDAVRGALVGELQRIIELPSVNHHQFRTLGVGPDGWLYYTIGAYCNLCEATGTRDQTILRSRMDGSAEEVYASGFRNVMGFDWHPESRALYANDCGADYQGEDFPPEEFNLVERGGFYGFPYSHGKGRPDLEFGQSEAARRRSAIPAIHTFVAHSTPLGLLFSRGANWPTHYRGVALIALHGSWNRTRKVGYKIVSLHGLATGEVEQREFIAGFELDEDVIGRPVGLAEGPEGAIYLSDDYAGAIYRIAPVVPAVAQSSSSVPTATALLRQGGSRLAEPSQVGVEPVQGSDPVRVASGLALFSTHECGRCHELTSVPGAKVALSRLNERYSIDSLVDFLAAPPPAMPTPALGAIERHALATYLLSR